MGEPRLAVIEGRPTAIVERVPPIPGRLDLLLGELRSVTFRGIVRPRGASVRCEAARDHRWEHLRSGRHVGHDGVVRDLRLDMCGDCGAVAVWDVTLDTLPGLAVGGLEVRRRHAILGWYTGKRRAGREYT